MPSVMGVWIFSGITQLNYRKYKHRDTTGVTHSLSTKQGWRALLGLLWPQTHKYLFGFMLLRVRSKKLNTLVYCDHIQNYLLAINA